MLGKRSQAGLLLFRRKAGALTEGQMFGVPLILNLFSDSHNAFVIRIPHGKLPPGQLTFTSTLYGGA